MKSAKVPRDFILQAIQRQYAYDVYTGVLSKGGKTVGKVKPGTSYLYAGVIVSDPSYLTVQCNLPSTVSCGISTTANGRVRRLTTNNRIDNLRLSTRAENNRNKGKMRTRPTTSRYVGVSYHKGKGKWQAYITCDGKRLHLGTFPTEEEAARSYDAAALRLFGRFARPNFPVVGNETTSSPS